MRSRVASAAHTSAATLLVVAVPITLVRLGRWPRPQGSWTTLLRSWVEEPLSGGFLAAIAYLAAWLLWAMLAAAITARLYAQAARMSRRLPRLHMPGPLQGITAAVLGATAVSTAATATPADANATTTPAAETTHAPQGPAATARAHADDQTTSPTNGKDQARHTYTVRRGDTLSRIAQDRLGDADRWPEIFTANRGTRFPHTGGTLRDPDLIYPGWTLRLPPTVEAPRPSPRPAPAPTPTTSTPSGPSSSPTGTDTDDGLVESAPAPTSAPADHASASGPAATPTTRTADDRTAPTPRPQPGVSLGTGSWLDMGLAAAVLAAVALVWAHRRRRYIPQQPTARPRLDDPSVEPMPAVVTRIRRGLRALTPSTKTIPDPNPDLDPPPDEPVADADSEPADAADDETSTLTAHESQPPIPAPTRPLIEVWPSAGLGLIGPGAEAAARGALVSALAAGGPDDPNSRHHVVIASDTLTMLLGTTTITLADTPRMTITSGLSDALTLIEERTLHRARLCGDYEVDTIADLRDRDPIAEPVPPTVLIAAPTAAHVRARIAALLTQGHRLDIHGVLLGAWPDGDTILVAEDGSTSIIKHDAKQHSCPSAVGRLSVINRSETAELLRLLAESHTGEPQPPAPAQRVPLPATVRHLAENSNAAPQSDDEAAPQLGPRPANAGRRNVLTPPQSVDIPAEVQPSERRAPVSTAPPRPVIGQGPRRAAASGVIAGLPDHTDIGDPDRLVVAADDPNPTPEHSATAQPHERRDHASNEPHPAGDDQSSRTGALVDVRVFGGARIVDMDTTTPLRAKALELLVYLVVQDGDAAQDSILDDLLPDAPASKAPHRLHTYVSALRKTLVLTGGPATYLTHPSRRYALNRDALDTDLWRMRAALRDAARATTDADRTAALQRAVDAYDGTLADGFDYEWIEAYREGIRRQALDAHLALAAATPDPTQALTVLKAAIRHDPYAEAIYQQAMRAHAALGHLEQVRSLRRALTRRLDEIDAEPSEDTLRLADRLIADLRRQKPTGKTDSHNSGLHP